MVAFCPSITPYSAKPLRKASTKCALSLADRALRNPITGLFAGCASTASGQTAEQAISLMNARRLIVALAAYNSYRNVKRQVRKRHMSALGQKRTLAILDPNIIPGRPVAALMARIEYAARLNQQ